MKSASAAPAAPTAAREDGDAEAGGAKRIFRRVDGPLLRGAIGVLVALAIAELITRAELVGGGTLPPASDVVKQVGHLLTDGDFLSDLWATVLAWALGLAIATVISVPLGIVLGMSKIASQASSAVIEFMRPIPAVALIPLAILVWGQGLTMKLVLVAYATIWPILFNTVYGVHDVDAGAVQAARAFGLPRLAIVRRVILPSAAPFVLTGIRISASVGLIVLVGAELLAGAATGIGAYISQVSQDDSQLDLVLAAAAIAGLLGVVSNMLLGWADRRLFAWYHARNGGRR
jgi:NitT/TauT family transport system permease protein